MSEEKQDGSGDAAVPGTEGHPAERRAATQEIRIDDSHANTCYANFCRVTGGPEELILDLGFNPQPTGVPAEPIRISQRLILNFYTAKRLLGALNMAVQRHEGTFGVLETDINKRVKRQATL